MSPGRCRNRELIGVVAARHAGDSIGRVTGSERAVPSWLTTPPDDRWDWESEAVACERLAARALAFVRRLLAEFGRHGVTAVFVRRHSQPDDVVIAVEQAGVGLGIQLDEAIEVVVVFDEQDGHREFGDWSPTDDRFEAAFGYVVSEYFG